MNNITFKSHKRFTAFCAILVAIGFVVGFVFGLMIPNAGADDAIDYSSSYTSEVVADHGIYRYVPNQPYTYGSDYYRDNTKTHKTEHGGKPSYYCKACIDFYLDMGGYVLAREGDIVYYTGVDLVELRTMQGENRNFTAMRDPRLFTYGNDIFNPPLVSAQPGACTVGEGIKFGVNQFNAYVATQQRQELLCSAIDNMLLRGESCFLGIYTFYTTNYNVSGSPGCGICAIYGDSSGSFTLSTEGTIDGHTSYRLKASSGTHYCHIYFLTSSGWSYFNYVAVNATGTVLGSVNTGGSFQLQYCYPLIASVSPTTAVAMMTGDLTLPAQRSTTAFAYPRFTSVSSATHTSGSLLGIDTAITSKIAWLAIRQVYNLDKLTTGGGSSDYEYTEEEYLAYGEQKKQEGIETVVNNPSAYALKTHAQFVAYGTEQKQAGIDLVTHNPHSYQLRTEAEYTEWGTTMYDTGILNGIAEVVANPSDYGIHTGEIVQEVVQLPIESIMNAILESPATIARSAFGSEGLNREVFGISFYDVLLVVAGISMISVAVVVIKKFL